MASCNASARVSGGASRFPVAPRFLIGEQGRLTRLVIRRIKQAVALPPYRVSSGDQERDGSKRARCGAAHLVAMRCDHSGVRVVYEVIEQFAQRFHPDKTGCLHVCAIRIGGCDFDAFRLPVAFGFVPVPAGSRLHPCKPERLSVTITERGVERPLLVLQPSITHDPRRLDKLNKTKRRYVGIELLELCPYPRRADGHLATCEFPSPVFGRLLLFTSNPAPTRPEEGRGLKPKKNIYNFHLVFVLHRYFSVLPYGSYNYCSVPL